MNLKKYKKEYQEKRKLRKQLEQEQNQRNGHHIVFSGEGEGRNSREKVPGRRSIIGRHKIDVERSKMV